MTRLPLPPVFDSTCSLTLSTSQSIGTPPHASSPVLFSAPHTPSYTPCCTPRRLSLSLGESSTNLRDSTKTTSTSLGLVRLLQEGGISASVYDPCSWDRALDAGGASAIIGRIQEQRCTARPGESEVTQLVTRPSSLLLQPPSPPCSPRPPRTAFQFSPVSDDPPYRDAFLASKPARTILREVLGDSERERAARVGGDSQSEVTSLGLVDKLRRFPTLSPLSAAGCSGSALLAPFSSTGVANSTLGGGLPGLNTGLRRNRSYPAMVGASMAMKDPGGPPCTLITHTIQTSQTQEMEAPPERGKVQPKPPVRKAVPPPQTLNALKPVTRQTVVQRRTRADRRLQAPTRQDDDGTRT